MLTPSASLLIIFIFFILSTETTRARGLVFGDALGRFGSRQISKVHRRSQQLNDMRGGSNSDPMAVNPDKVCLQIRYCGG